MRSEHTWQPALQKAAPVPQKPNLEQQLPDPQKCCRFGAPQEPSVERVKDKTSGDGDAAANAEPVEDDVAMLVPVRVSAADRVVGDVGAAVHVAVPVRAAAVAAAVAVDGVHRLQPVAATYWLLIHAMPGATACHGPYDDGERGAVCERHMTNPSAQVETGCGRKGAAQSEQGAG